jgi:hypothetical protein
MLDVDKLESCLVLGILNDVTPIKEFTLGTSHSTKMVKLRSVIFVPTDPAGLQKPLPRERIDSCKSLSELRELLTASPTTESGLRGLGIIWIDSA